MIRPLLCLSLLFSFASAFAEPKPKLVVTIIVDQLRSDYLDRFDADFVDGGFRRFTREGAFMAQAHYDYAPTITGPGHASYLSGAGPALHGIIGNNWYDKRTGKTVYCCDDASVEPVGTKAKAGKMSPRNFIGATFADQMRLHYGSKVVGISLKDRGAILPAGKKPVAAYWFEPATGNFISSSYYMEKLPAWVEEFNARQLPKSYAGRKWERLLPADRYQNEDNEVGEGKLAGEKAVTFPHTINIDAKGNYDPIIPTPFGNELVIEMAKAIIENEKLGQGSQPDVLCMSFSSNDYVGHKFGPYSHEVQDVTLRLDRQLADFFKYLDEKIGLKNVVAAITADHGVAPSPEYARKQGLAGTRLDSVELLGQLTARLNERLGPGRYLQTQRIHDQQLYFNHPFLRERQIDPETVCDVVREWALDTGLFHAVYSRRQLLEGHAPGVIGQRVAKGFNAERSGDLVLIPKPYAIWGGTDSGTSHSMPWAYDTHVPIAFFGAPFKPGRYSDEFYITDIAAMLSAALHINPPPLSMGKPLVKALAQ